MNKPDAAPIVFTQRGGIDTAGMSAHHIVLSTLNAKYIHASLGLRYLQANLAELSDVTSLQEFTINQRPIDIVENLLTLNPAIVGFGVYIWNVAQTTEVVALLKTIRPEITIVIGGPEVSHEFADTEIYRLCDHLITGQADFAFRELCIALLTDQSTPAKLITASEPSVKLLEFPYQFYDSDDIANRVLYVEASRGCPFKCEFCLSALDKTAKPFDLDRFLQQMAMLYERGARQFKFVDRTFNLKAQSCIAILQFFLERLDDQLFLHFEVIPDKLPDALKTVLQQFPPGSLQFEVGIQSFNPDVQQTISRKQDDIKTIENLQWLRQHTNAYIHADLIVGLPGETLASFAAGFNQLAALAPHEIQVGILKRLRGTNITRHTESYAMHYSPLPPYQLLQNADLDFNTMQDLQRFARYWDLIANSSRFNHSLPLLLGSDPFDRFWRLSDWLFRQTGQTHRISLARLFGLLYQAVGELDLHNLADFTEALDRDHRNSGEKKTPIWRQIPSRSKHNANLGTAQHAKRQSRAYREHQP